MSRTFFLTGDQILFIANDGGADLRYRAHSHEVAAGVQVPARSNERSDMIFVVEQGVLEFMIGGAVGHVSAGGFVRVQAGISFAYRNPGPEPVHLLSRPIARQRGVRRASIEVAA